MNLTSYNVFVAVSGLFAVFIVARNSYQWGRMEGYDQACSELDEKREEVYERLARLKKEEKF